MWALSCLLAVGLSQTSVHAGSADNRVRAIEYNTASGGDAAPRGTTTIRIAGTRTPTFTMYTLQRPTRVVIDVANAVLDRKIAGRSAKATWSVGSWSVTQVESHAIESSGRKSVRVIVTLARPGSYDVRADGEDLLVVVTPGEAAPVSSSDADAKELQTLRGARAEAEAAKREIRQLKRAAAVSREAADKAIAAARAEAEGTRTRARERARQADVRMAKASTMIADAESRLKRARKTERAAEKARADARTASARVAEREREAEAAERRLSSRQAEARRAEKAAQTYLANAANARGDRDKAAALRARAEKATRAAEKRRAEAEKAAKAAERARSAAERAASAAERRSSEAMTALRAAETERSAAERAVSVAEERRARAERRQKLSEKRRAEAEAAATEAGKRAARARELRNREEAAFAKISKAKKRAARGQRAADDASQRLAKAKKLSVEAEAHLAAMRAETKEARRRLARASKRKNSSEQEIAALKKQAKELAKSRAQAERDLRSRTRAVKNSEREVAKLERARKRKASELSRVEKAAKQAKTAREREEKLLAELVARRSAAERELQEAERAAERARSEADKLTQAMAAHKRAGKQRTAKGAIAGQVRDLSFEDKERVARVVIALSGDARPRVISTKGRQAILEVPNAALPTQLQRKLDTSRYRGPIKAISSYRDPRNPKKTRVVVDLTRPAKSALKRSGSTYYWDFAKRRTEVAQKTVRHSRSRSKARSQPPLIVGGFGASSTPITQKSIAQLSQRKRKVYRGTKIDLDFKDADIHNLLRMLADVGGVNIVIPDEIQARVTVRLRRVPWDQALEVILASKGLWYRREGNLYRVAPRKQLDAEDEAEATRLANLVKTETPEPEIFTLNYAVAKDLKDQLTPLLSPKGRIEVDSRTNSLIINDVRANRRRVIDMVTRLDTQTPQVQIEARIVEARSSFTREIGVQWGGNANQSSQGGNATGLIFPNSIGISGGAEDNQTILDGIAPSPSDFAVNLPAAVGSGAGGAIGLALGSVGGNLNLSLRLSALEDTGSVRIISAPKITVLNNVKAEISQGVSIPVSVISANGTQTQFVPADLSLQVTPHVSQRDCSVQMELNVAKNEPDFVNTGARGDPSILRKEAKTTILVADGETTVIGGIYTRNTGLAYSKVPFFGDLPVIGWLFKNRSEADERSEVLVFITPKITNKAFLRCE